MSAEEETVRTYHLRWTVLTEWSGDVTSEELADALGVSVAEVKESIDPESGDYGVLDLENGLAVIEERGDVFDGCTREVISVRRVRPTGRPA